MSRRIAPPLLARVLLRLALPRSWRASALGDLEEEWRGKFGGRCRSLRARLWFLARAMEISARFSLDQAGGLLSRFRPPEGHWAEERKRSKGDGFMDSFLHDVRYAARMLRRNRGFAAVAVLTLGLGIGANTAIFSVVNAVLLRPLPFRAPDRLVRLRDTVERPGQEPKIYNTSPRNFYHLKEQEQIFEGITAQEFRWFNLTGAGDPAQIRGIGVAPGWAEFLGAAPVRGRAFLPEEERPGDDSRAVLVGYGLWQRGLHRRRHHAAPVQFSLRSRAVGARQFRSHRRRARSHGHRTAAGRDHAGSSPGTARPAGPPPRRGRLQLQGLELPGHSASR
jgi:hypothetical protein